MLQALGKKQKLTAGLFDGHQKKQDIPKVLVTFRRSYQIEELETLLICDQQQPIPSHPILEQLNKLGYFAANEYCISDIGVFIGTDHCLDLVLGRVTRLD